jgi:hypothetical protein
MCDIVGRILIGKTNCSETSSLSAKLSNKFPTWNGLGLELYPLCERPTPKRLSHGVAFNDTGLPVEGSWDNVQLQTRSPTNDVDQCLNWLAKKVVPF